MGRDTGLQCHRCFDHICMFTDVCFQNMCTYSSFAIGYEPHTLLGLAQEGIVNDSRTQQFQRIIIMIYVEEVKLKKMAQKLYIANHYFALS